MNETESKSETRINPQQQPEQPQQQPEQPQQPQQPEQQPYQQPDQQPEQQGILSASFGLSKEFITFIYTIGLTETIKILNYVLSTIKTQLEGIVPNEQDKQQAINTNISLLQTIEMIVKSPEFQKKWSEFAEQIAQLLKILLSRIADVTENEAQEIMDNLTNLVQTNAGTFVNGLGMGIMEGVCALPPVVPFCELAVVVGTGSKLTGKTLITAMDTTSKLAEAFSKVVGDSAQHIVETIESIQGFIQYIKNAQENISTGVVDGIQKVQKGLETISKTSTSTSTSTPQKQPYSDISEQVGGEKKYSKKSHKNTSKRKKQNHKHNNTRNTRKRGI
jgi:hypothetical protein